MSTTIITIVGFLVTIAFVYLVFTEKMNVQFAFIVIPILGALVLGHSFTEIKDWVISGVTSNAGTVAYAIFLLLFFQTMNHAGAFDDITNFIVKKFEKNLLMICIAGWLVATVTTLDGAAPSTVVVTIPAMLPIYKKMKIRPLFLGFQVALVCGTLSVVPWSGYNLQYAAALGTDVSSVFYQNGMAPAMIVGYVVAFVFMLIMAKQEIKRIETGKNDFLLAEVAAETATVASTVTTRQKKVRPINLVLIVFLLVCLFTGWINATLVAMIACGLAFVINYPDSKSQQRALQAGAPAALTVAGLFIAAGPYSQIMSQTGMMGGMVNALLSLFPTSVAGILHILLSCIMVPVTFLIGQSTIIYGISPVLANMANAASGVTLETFHAVAGTAISPNLLASTTAPAQYMMLDLLGGVKLKDHAKYSLVWLWAVSIVMMLVVIFLN